MLFSRGFAACIFALGSPLASAAPASAVISWAPMQFRTISGIRPFVKVEMGGKPFLMMIHSSASFDLMTIHAHAVAAGVTNLVRKDRYGIVSPGRTTDLEREKGNLPRLDVAGRTFANLPILVFEVPQDPPVDGMLGLRWLQKEGIILDYDTYRVGIPATINDAQAEDRRLVAAGYVPHRLSVTGSGTYELSGKVNGTKTKFGLSTVGDDIMDLEAAKLAAVPVGPVVDDYGGPTGTQGPVYLAKRQLRLLVDGQAVAPIRPLIYDTYAYEGKGRVATPDADHKVRLGANFLLANGAVIDFATSTLFLRPRD